VGGGGKSALLHALTRAVEAEDWGRVVVTAFTGAAAAPFHGPTLMRLLLIGVCKGHKFRAIDATELTAIHKRFEDETGFPIDQLAALIIDEISFVTAAMIGLVDERLRLMTGRKDAWFGGVAVMLVGDNMQLSPPGGKPWHRVLVELAANARSCTGDVAVAMSDLSTPFARGLGVMRAAHRADLMRIMRSASDP
jgi:hypothetical protein